jgi:hypothetical protein
LENFVIYATVLLKAQKPIFLLQKQSKMTPEDGKLSNCQTDNISLYPHL